MSQIDIERGLSRRNEPRNFAAMKHQEYSCCANGGTKKVLHIVGKAVAG